MGLFSNLRKMQTSPNQEVIARAVIAPAVLVMAADDSISDAEIGQLANSCAFSPIFAPIPPARSLEIVKEIARDFSVRGPRVVIEEAITQMSPGLRETALAIAMRVALADGRLDESERLTLIALSKDMGITEKVTEVMFHVVGILQRGPND